MWPPGASSASGFYKWVLGSFKGNNRVPFKGSFKGVLGLGMGFFEVLRGLGYYGLLEGDPLRVPLWGSCTGSFKGTIIRVL